MYEIYNCEMERRTKNGEKIPISETNNTTDATGHTRLLVVEEMQAAIITKNYRMLEDNPCKGEIERMTECIGRQI